MSSEKRSIALNTFESEVPPLKRSRPLNSSIEKSWLSIQQTQKSFSTRASGKPNLFAVSVNRSARVLAFSVATLFKQVFRQSSSQSHRSIRLRIELPL